MSTCRIKQLAFGATAVLTIISSSAQAASIKVAVAANFTTTLGAIITQFNTLYPSDSVSYTANSTGVLKGEITGGNAPGYDLFLSADLAAPQDLSVNFSSLVVGSPFLYAKGSLELWSKTVNISAGLPNPIGGVVAIANPATAPYGKAAQQVLASSPWNITLPNASVAQYTNISVTYQIVNQGARPFGFIAKSAICTKPGATEVFTPGTFHHSYLYNDASHPYSQILQYGIKINRTGRTAAQTTVLNNFTNFLLGVGSSLGTAKIQYYCYQLP